MKIYVVCYFDYDGGNIDSVFIDKSKADLWAIKTGQDVREYDTDEIDPDYDWYEMYISEGDKIENFNVENSYTWRKEGYQLCVGNKRYKVIVKQR